VGPSALPRASLADDHGNGVFAVMAHAHAKPFDAATLGERSSAAVKKEGAAAVRPADKLHGSPVGGFVALSKRLHGRFFRGESCRQMRGLARALGHAVGQFSCGENSLEIAVAERLNGAGDLSNLHQIRSQHPTGFGLNIANVKGPT
jgi:hypothetical protein